MAACSSNGELSGQFSIENDSDSSDFSDSDSDEEQTIDDNIYGYPNDVEGRNFAENDEDIESVGSDFDSDDNQNVYMNEVSEIAFVNEDTVGQVFISNERDDASTDTSATSNPPRPRKRRRVTTGTQNQARRLQQQQPQFIWNQNIQTTLFPNSISDLVQLVCGEVSQVRPFVSSYSGMMHYLNFKEK